MKVKLERIVNSANPLTVLSARELGIRLAYKLSKIVRKIEPHIEDYQKLQKQVLRKHADQNQTDELMISYKFANIQVREEYEAEHQILLDEVVDLDVEPIQIQEIADHIEQLPPNILTLLDWLIVGELDTDDEPAPDSK